VAGEVMLMVRVIDRQDKGHAGGDVGRYQRSKQSF
jgi:hypothetical protein